MDIDIELGDVAYLSLKLTDGATGLFPRAVIYSPAPVPVATVDLTDSGQGLYRATWLPPATGAFDVVDLVFSDAGHTTDAEYEQGLDRLLVREPRDQALLGVSYDEAGDTLYLQASLNRSGEPLTSPVVTAVSFDVYDADNSVLFTVSDAAPDGQGVFRASKPAPGLIADRLYSVKMTFTTSYGSVVRSRGFMTTT